MCMGEMFFIFPIGIMKIYDQFGVARDIKYLNAANKLFTLKKKSGSNPWPVVEECLKIWTETHPTQYNSFLVDLTDIKETRKNKFASSDQEAFRYTLDIPETVMYMIRMVYSAEELPMDKSFLRAWGKKFPKMKIAERI